MVEGPRVHRITAMEHHEYLDTIAAQLVNELRPILSIKAVTANTDLLGKYTDTHAR
jgi:hypothetical protein